MRTTPPHGVDDHVVAHQVALGWGMEASSLTYLPLGAGGYHWRLDARGGARYFVTVDDLDTKDWLGVDREAVAAGLEASYGTARRLYDAAVGGVVAPIPSLAGRSLRRISEQFTVSVSPYVDGAAQPFGPHDDRVRRHAVLDLLISLHSVTPPLGLPDYRKPRIGQRAELESFLADPFDPWLGGPLGERARALLAPRAEALGAQLAAFDEATVAVEAAHAVVTHGEPHGANVLTVGDRELLIDWDTVGLAVPDRDLWFAIIDDEDARYYAAATGHRPSGDMLTLYRTRWRFDDLCWVVRTLRSRHGDDDETRRHLEALEPNLDALLTAEVRPPG